VVQTSVLSRRAQIGGDLGAGGLVQIWEIRNGEGAFYKWVKVGHVRLIWTTIFWSDAGFHVSTETWFPQDTFSEPRGMPRCQLCAARLNCQAWSAYASTELGDVPKVRFGATVTPLPGAAESGGTVVTVARHGSSATDSRPPHLLGMGKPKQRYFKFASSTSFTNHFFFLRVSSGRDSFQRWVKFYKKTQVGKKIYNMVPYFSSKHRKEDCEHAIESLPPASGLQGRGDATPVQAEDKTTWLGGDLDAAETLLKILSQRKTKLAPTMASSTTRPTFWPKIATATCRRHRRGAVGSRTSKSSRGPPPSPAITKSSFYLTLLSFNYCYYLYLKQGF
jgi:hypothetical protein